MHKISEINLIDIIVVGECFEALAIRNILESFQLQTRIHYIGNADHFVSLFKDKNYLYKTIIISCHGKNKKMLLPQLAPQFEKEMPFHKALTAINFLEILNLNDQIIINTGCTLGTKEVASSFLNKGAEIYIGPKGYQEASCTIIFIVNLLYFHYVKNLPIITSFNKVQNLNKDTKLFKLWQ